MFYVYVQCSIPGFYVYNIFWPIPWHIIKYSGNLCPCVYCIFFILMLFKSCIMQSIVYIFGTHSGIFISLSGTVLQYKRCVWLCIGEHRTLSDLDKLIYGSCFRYKYVLLFYFYFTFNL